MDHNNLGKLVDLPCEIRTLIWKEMRPQIGCKYKSDMSILRVCRQLFDEISPTIYDHEILNFKVSPLYKHRSWIRVTNQLGVIWPLASQREAISLGFGKLPYQRLEAINIEIQAPDETDPGQMICLWTKVRELVDLLSSAGELPRINIHLQDTEYGKWAEDGKPQKSIITELDFTFPPDFDFDYGIILMLFCRLRNAQKVKIHVPEGVKMDCGYLLHNHETMMELKVPYGELFYSRDSGVFGDPSIQQDLDYTFVLFDYALDQLHGRTASMMRLLRFSSWYDDQNFGKSRYIDEWERISQHSAETSDGCFVLSDVAHLKWRYRLMVAFNPLSAKMQKMRFRKRQYQECLTQDQLARRYPPGLNFAGWSCRQWRNYLMANRDPKKYKEKDRGERAEERELITLLQNEQIDDFSHREEEDDELVDFWDPEEWLRYYPDGLPPLEEELFMFEIEMGHLWSEDSPIEPRERFQGWDEAELDWETFLKASMVQRSGRSVVTPISWLWNPYNDYIQLAHRAAGNNGSTQ